MRNGILLAGIAFAVASAIVIRNRLSNEAMAVVVGAVCGISASIPVSVGFLIAASRHWGRESGSESGRMAPSPELSRYAQPPVVVIAPDRHEKGTNALLLSPANLIEYDFGGDSFRRHCERARRAGARLEVVKLPSLGLDLDLPEDLELIRKLEGAGVHS